jgi:hypothetical protein
MLILNIFNTPIKAKSIVLINIFGLWGITTLFGIYRHPGRGLIEALVIGLIAMLLLLVADFGHALAHIFSAKAAGAPMDQILISAGMPRTLYHNDDIPPAAHRARALGGPLFSLVGTAFSLAVYIMGVSAPLLRELAGWSLIGHAFILVGSLLPLPVVDGGSIIKWTMVIHGFSENKADKILQRFNLFLGIAAVGIGVVFFILGFWIGGIIAIGVGGISLTAAAGKIK